MYGKVNVGFGKHIIMLIFLHNLFALQKVVEPFFYPYEEASVFNKIVYLLMVDASVACYVFASWAFAYSYWTSSSVLVR